ncbi:MAG: class I SAM-dependent methyltransferase [Oscillospiraceae bacterium]|nr:class I SAM-dependent methyltransferase [Oscillospiraceae bacterium]
MNEVNKTMYIPLYGKSFVSQRGKILHDPKAEEIWQQEGFPLKGKAASKWLAYYMGMRSRVFDDWLKEKLENNPGAVVLHIGCGMDSRICRVKHAGHLWYDIDFPDVIHQRKKHYAPMADYHMIPSDARDTGYLQQIPRKAAVVLMEGISMYLQQQELSQLLADLYGHFEKVDLLMDCYTVFAAKASKYKNPVNEVGVTTLYGLDDPRELERSGMQFVKERSLTPEYLIEELTGWEKVLFRKLYAGSAAKKLYRLYEFSSEKG